MLGAGPADSRTGGESSSVPLSARSSLHTNIVWGQAHAYHRGSMVSVSVAPLEADLSGAYSTELRLTTNGRIVDFLDPEKSRPNTPEERVRQVYARRLHYDYGYPKSVMAIEVPIQIGASERGAADIVVYANRVAAQTRDQSQIRIVVETKAPDKRRGLISLT